MDYKEPALMGFVQAAIDYLNYSKGAGEKVELGNLSSPDINFLKDNLGLNFDSDAAAILKGHQVFRDMIYKRQSDREGLMKQTNNISNDTNSNLNDPSDLFKTQDNYETNQAASEESSKAIDKLFNQIESGVNSNEEKIDINLQNETINLTRNSDRVNTIKETINKIKNTAGKELRIANREDVDPIFEYAEKEEEYYKLVRSVSKIFTKLPLDFIKDVLYCREEIENEYPINVPVIVLHRLSFNDVGELRKFAEIMIEHQYFVNADEKKGIVDVFKQVVNTSGKIITLICEVANQAIFVNGVYEGYKVLKTE